MSHYTIRYTGTKQEKVARAYADCVEWIGDSRRLSDIQQLVWQILRADGFTMRKRYDQCLLALAFAGIQWFAAKAFIRTVWNKNQARESKGLV